MSSPRARGFTLLSVGLGAFLFLWFVNAAAPAARGARPGRLDLQTFGSVKALIEHHDAAGKVTLGSILGAPHAFGLGSLSDLRGEITIVDGVAWLAYPPATAHAPGGKARVTSSASSNEKAGFLVATHVAPAAWRRMKLPTALSSDELEATLARLTSSDPTDPTPTPVSLPFRIDGHLEHVTLAVVDGRQVPPGPGTEDSMQKANFLQREDDADGVLIGFFASQADSPFTHEGKHSHVHATLPGRQATGHAQSFRLAAGATLMMP
jgi:acetolactate decarboxylase